MHANHFFIQIKNPRLRLRRSKGDTVLVTISEISLKWNFPEIQDFSKEFEDFWTQDKSTFCFAQDFVE